MTVLSPELFRSKLEGVFRQHFTPNSGATECMMALYGAFFTVAQARRNPNLQQRDAIGVSEILYSFTTGLTFGNNFWQRASVVLVPMMTMAQLNVGFAAQYAEQERQMSPTSPQAAELRRKTAECLGSLHNIAVAALLLDQGLGYVEAKGTAFRDQLDELMKAV